MTHLNLILHTKNDVIFPVKQGLLFLGHQIYPGSHVSVDQYMIKEINSKLNENNISSYGALLAPRRKKKSLPWLLIKSQSDQ